MSSRWGAANYQCEFRTEPELRRFVDFLIASPAMPDTSRLYLHPSVTPVRPEHYLSNLRFQFDAEHDVAAAVVLVIDRNHDDEVLAWMTRGEAGSRTSPGSELRNTIQRMAQYM